MKVLFRPSLAEKGEIRACEPYFPCVTSRMECEAELVIGRYSCLPYYAELERDLQHNGCGLINSYEQHRWIANFEYYDVLKEHTPKTWTDDNFHACEHPGPFVVKGRTNSRKLAWDSMMFAPTKQDALRIASTLLQDSMIGEQGIVYRQYVPLETYEVGINGLPFTNEWRFFFFRDTLLSYGYYWDIADHIRHNDDIEAGGIEFAMDMAKLVRPYVRFFVLDIARTTGGNWIVVEVNDGQMSGLSNNNPDTLYRNLRYALNPPPDAPPAVLGCPISQIFQCEF